MNRFRYWFLLVGVVLAGLGQVGAAELSGGAIITRTPLRNAPAKFTSTGKGTVAFLGGSITEGNYYRPIVTADLQTRFPDTTFTFIAAGLSSTCSTAGAFRFSSDILAKGTPDVLFVEFAVNDDQDAHYTAAVCRAGMEGIVRQARRANPQMDIIMILFTNKGELDLVSAGSDPIPFASHTAVAEHYGIPTVNIAKALVNSTAAGTFTWTDYGANCHPNAAGSQFGADCIAELLTAEGWGTTVATPSDYPMPAILESTCYDYAHWVSPLRCTRDANFNYSKPDWSKLTSCRANYSSEPILWSTTPGSTFTLKFKGTKFGAFVLAGSDTGILEISIDGDAFTSHDLYNTTYSQSLQFPYARVFREGLEDADHLATCRVSASKNSASSGTAIRLYRVGVDGADDLAPSTTHTSATGITWQDPTAIQGDTDVDTTGLLLYAWCVTPSTKTENSDILSLNGVTFVANRNARRDLGGDLTDNTLSNLNASTSYTWAGGVSTGTSLSASYRKLLGGGFYNSSTPYGDTITLKRLVPGREYLVQLWCSRGTTAASGEKMLIDNIIEVATSGSPSGAGEVIKGTFRAKSSTQNITLQGSGTIGCFNAIQVRDISPAPKVTWEQAKDVSADSDVRTDGVLRYAYGGSDATINGVVFKKGMSSSNIGPNTTELSLSDASVTALVNYNWNNYFKAGTLPSGCSSGYRSLIDGSAFGSFFTTGYLKLKRLIPGHRYLVQFWVNDSREHPGTDRYLRPDDDPNVTVSYRTANLIGQHCTGTFTAAASEQLIALVPYSRTSVQSGSQLSSFQLRDITPGIIAWETPKTITAVTDIRTDGTALYAYSFGESDATLNGVVFRAQKTSTYGTGSSIDFSGAPGVNRTAFGNTASGNVTAAYTQITRGSLYINNGPMDITLKGLVPGGRYLIQLWTNDSRAVGPNRFLVLDGGTRLCERASSTFGQYATGTFTASDTTFTFTIEGASLWSEDNYCGATQLNGIQVRRLDAPSTRIEWQTNEISQNDSDARTDGTLAYAYNYGGVAASINGIAFAASAYNAGAVQFSNFSGDNGSAFFNAKDSGTSTGYQNMIKSASSTQLTPAPTTVTLTQLTPGHRYLVQFWVNDFRDAPGYDRYMILDDTATLNYKKSGAPSRGDFAIGLFTATATTQSFTLQACTRTSVAAANQINGLQVRDLGADAAQNIWAGGASGDWLTDGTNWVDSANVSRAGTTLWDATNGATNSALFTAAATALPTADLTANNLFTTDALTIGAADDGRTLALNGTVCSSDLTLNSGLANTALRKADTGTWQINGACDNLTELLVGAGSLAFGRALPEDLAVTLATGATLTPAASTTPSFATLDGAGTLAFDGTLEIASARPSTFNGAFDGDVTVRKTGSSEFIYGGTATGTVAFDVREGTVLLTGTVPAASVTLASGAALDLAGGSRTLGTVTGAGTLRDGTVANTLTLNGTFTAETLSTPNGITLQGASRLAFTGDATLGGVTVHLANPSQLYKTGVFLSTTGAFVGKPNFTYGERLYRAALNDAGTGYEIVSISGMLIILN